MVLLVLAGIGLGAWGLTRFAPAPEGAAIGRRAPDYRVPQTDDHYMCFTIAAPTDRERFIRRIDAVVDESRVLHHLVQQQQPNEPHDRRRRDLTAPHTPVARERVRQHHHVHA